MGREKLEELNDWIADQLQRIYRPGSRGSVIFQSCCPPQPELLLPLLLLPARIKIRPSLAGALLLLLDAIESWWVIVRLEERLEASFDAANAERMANELFEEWLEQSLNERINSLTHQATQNP